MTGSFTIREIRSSDFDQWKVLWDGYNAFYGREGPTALPLEITQLTWQRFQDAAEPVHALVAEQDGTLLGLVHFLYHRSTIAKGLNCYLQDLFTAHAARGQGVGRALIEAVYALARTAGSPRVYWHTQNHNATARRLYDQIGQDPGVMLYQKVL